MKILKRLLVLGLVVLVLGLAFVWVYFDPLVEKAIEKGATYATGVETQVASVSASPFAGTFGLARASRSRTRPASAPSPS